MKVDIYLDYYIIKVVMIDGIEFIICFIYGVEGDIL